MLLKVSYGRKSAVSFYHSGWHQFNFQLIMFLIYAIPPLAQVHAITADSNLGLWVGSSRDAPTQNHRTRRHASIPIDRHMCLFCCLYTVH